MQGDRIDLPTVGGEACYAYGAVSKGVFDNETGVSHAPPSPFPKVAPILKMILQFDQVAPTLRIHLVRHSCTSRPILAALSTVLSVV